MELSPPDEIPPGENGRILDYGRPHYGLKADPLRPTKRSVMGVTSFVLALLGVLTMAIMIAVAVAAGPDDAPNRKAADAVIACMNIGVNTLGGLGLLFGIGGIAQREKKKGFGVAGLILSVLVSLGMGCLTGLGSVRF